MPPQQKNGPVNNLLDDPYSLKISGPSHKFCEKIPKIVFLIHKAYTKIIDRRDRVEQFFLVNQGLSGPTHQRVTCTVGWLR